jgi:hypothetical protein
VAKIASPLILLTAAVPGLIGTVVDMGDDIHEIALFFESSSDYVPAGVNPELSIVVEVARYAVGPWALIGSATVTSPGGKFDPRAPSRIPFAFIRARSQGSPLQAGTMSAGIYLGDK